MLYCKMGNGRLIAIANREISRKEINKLQKKEWVRGQGGICAVITYTAPHAIYFINNGLGK